jgi:hypothetical protein
MAFILLKEYKTRSLDYEANEKGDIREYDRTWLAVSNDYRDDAVAVINEFSATTGIVKGTKYPSDSLAYLKSLKAQCDAEDGLNWIITGHYGQFPMGSQDNCPWHQPADWTWSFQQFQTTVEYDQDGKHIANSAGDVFPGVVRDQVRPFLSVVQYEQTFDPLMAFAYVDKVNSGGFLGCPARTVKVANIGGQRMWSQEWGYYWRVSYEFAFNGGTNGWDLQLLDQGFYETATDDDGNPIKIPAGMRQTGVASSTPMMLNGSGKVADPGADPYWKTFKIYQAVPFQFNFR